MTRMNDSQMTETPMPERSAWQVPAYETDFWRGRRYSRCVIIPVINEGSRIESLLHRMQGLGVPDIADIILVDGGSTDGSLAHDMLQSLNVGGLLRKTGPGRLSAQLRCAYAFALDNGYVHIVTIDGNDKDDPAAIPAFFQALEAGADFVQASRYVEGGRAVNTPLMRTVAIRLIHAPLLRLFSGFPWTDTTQGFRGYSARLLADPSLAVFRDGFERYELLAYLSCRAPRLGFRCTELPTTRSYPAQGKVPTKISSVRGNFEVLSTLIRVCIGRLNPPRSGSGQS